MTTSVSRPRPGTADGLVPPGALGIVIATLEAMRGRRALHQVRPRMTRPAFESLVGLTATGGLKDSPVGRINAQMPSPTCVEATVSVNLAGRWLACAIRLDATYSGNWTCSCLGVVGLNQ